MALGKAEVAGPVECFGKTFDSDIARRNYYLGLLAEKLKDPEFRNTRGFPNGTDEDILRLSDPPYYTACPNPFLEDFIRHYAKPYDPDEVYRREPFAVDVSVGKTDQLYKAHGYHTKVPHLAIIPSILHYTKPGDVVVDGFCGSGMTGLAAQWCGTAPLEYRHTLEAAWKASGHAAPEWGQRYAILGDIGSAPTFIASNYTIPFDIEDFTKATEKLLTEAERELGWMWSTRHESGASECRINYTVWSEVFSCPNCVNEIAFLREAFDAESRKVADEFPCPKCHTTLRKRSLQRVFETRIDSASGEPWKRIQLRPLLINYSVGKTKFEKEPDHHDLEVLKSAQDLGCPDELPTIPFPIKKMYHGSRIAPKGFTHIHHMYLSRTAQVLSFLWTRVGRQSDFRLRNALFFWLDSQLVNLSVQNRYRPHVSFPYNPLSGVYYVSSLVSEADPFRAYRNKAKRMASAFSSQSTAPTCSVTTGDAASLAVSSNSVDYIFTDPPFGSNIFYADLNFLVEAWHRVTTNPHREAIVDPFKDKNVASYQNLMRQCFEEFYRVLKPGRWMTVVFSNSLNSVWRAIQEAMGVAGFVVADVRTLDKKQGSYRQVTSSAVKQDLVISSYKPSLELSKRFKLGSVTADHVWGFVSEHLRNVPAFVARAGDADVIVERTPQMLHDRMIAFFVQRQVAVPISSADFMAGLDSRYPCRDGMYFLSNQVAEYDRKRICDGVLDLGGTLHQVDHDLGTELAAFDELARGSHRKERLAGDLVR